MDIPDNAPNADHFEARTTLASALGNVGTYGRALSTEVLVEHPECLEHPIIQRLLRNTPDTGDQRALEAIRWIERAIAALKRRPDVRVAEAVLAATDEFLNKTVSERIRVLADEGISEDFYRRRRPRVLAAIVAWLDVKSREAPEREDAELHDAAKQLKTAAQRLGACLRVGALLGEIEVFWAELFAAVRPSEQNQEIPSASQAFHEMSSISLYHFAQCASAIHYLLEHPVPPKWIDGDVRWRNALRALGRFLATSPSGSVRKTSALRSALTRSTGDMVSFEHVLRRLDPTLEPLWRGWFIEAARPATTKVDGAFTDPPASPPSGLDRFAEETDHIRWVAEAVFDPAFERGEEPLRSMAAGLVALIVEHVVETVRHYPELAGSEFAASRIGNFWSRLDVDNEHAELYTLILEQLRSIRP